MVSSGGSDFSTFDSAFSGQSLMGTDMKTSSFSARDAGDVNRNPNKPREQMLGMGLPSGRGRAGPYAL
jgi:hypothetical protein